MRKFFGQKKFSHLKVVAVVFMAAFLLGIFLANVVGKNYLSQTGILSDYYLSKYKYMEIEYTSLFLFIMQKRLKWIILLWGMGLTVIGIPLLFGYSAWMGFSAGMILSVAVIRFGFLGIIICLVGVIPQGIIYGLCIVPFFDQVYRMSGAQLQSLKHKSLAGPKFSQYLMVLVIVVLIFTLGIFLESYINPIIIKKILINI